MTSHVLAGVKLVIAAAFVAYLIEFARSLGDRRDVDRETIDVVLILAVVGIVICGAAGAGARRGRLIRLYATQMLLVAGAIIVIMVERQSNSGAGALRA